MFYTVLCNEQPSIQGPLPRPVSSETRREIAARPSRPLLKSESPLAYLWSFVVRGVIPGSYIPYNVEHTSAMVARPLLSSLSQYGLIKNQKHIPLTNHDGTIEWRRFQPLGFH